MAAWEDLVQQARHGNGLGAMEGLQRLISDVNPQLRYDAVEALMHIALAVFARADAEEVKLCYDLFSRHLSKSVGDHDEYVRALALEGISSVLRRGDNDAGNRVAAHLKDWRGGVRRAAVEAIARLFAGGSAPESVLRHLADHVDDHDIEVREATTRVLPTICPEGSQAVIAALLPKLATIKQIEPRIRTCQVLWTVAKRGDGKVVRALCELLEKSDDSGIRREAARGLGKLGAPRVEEDKPNKHTETCVAALCAALGRATELPVMDPRGLAAEELRREEEQRARLEAELLAAQKAAEAAARAAEGQEDGEEEQGGDGDDSIVDVEETPKEATRPPSKPPTPLPVEKLPAQQEAEQEAADPGDSPDGEGAEAEEGAPPPEGEEEEEAEPEPADEPWPPESLVERYPHLCFDLFFEFEPIGKDEDPAVRLEALSSLESLAARGDRRALGALLLSLRDEDAEVCSRAMQSFIALYEHVPGDLAIVIAVAQMMMAGSNVYGNSNSRKAALQALVGSDGSSNRALAAVLSRHLEALRELGTLEAAAAERLLLLEALSRTVPEELQAHLADILLISLLDQSVEVRLLALRHLAPMGPDSPRVRGVADRLRDKQPAVKELAAEVLQTWNRA